VAVPRLEATVPGESARRVSDESHVWCRRGLSCAQGWTPGASAAVCFRRRVHPSGDGTAPAAAALPPAGGVGAPLAPRGHRLLRCGPLRLGEWWQPPSPARARWLLRALSRAPHWASPPDDHHVARCVAALTRTRAVVPERAHWHLAAPRPPPAASTTRLGPIASRHCTNVGSLESKATLRVTEALLTPAAGPTPHKDKRNVSRSGGLLLSMLFSQDVASGPCLR